MRGEKEVGNKGTREVGNVDPDTEITFQFGANELDADGEGKVFYFTTNQMKLSGLLTCQYSTVCCQVLQDGDDCCQPRKPSVSIWDTARERKHPVNSEGAKVITSENNT